MAITKTKLLIEISQNINTIATAVQLDGNSRFLDVSLHDKGLPIDLTGHVVRIHVRKPDGKTVFNQGEITDATAGRCQFALTAEMLSEAKELKAQISIWNSDTEILSTKVFKILVTESLRNDEEVEASNEFGVLVVLFTEIQSALELMRELVSAFGEPGEMAAAYGVDTFWAMLEHLAAGADVRQVLKENINSTMDTEEFAPLDKLIANTFEPHGVQEFTSSGTFVVPEGVHKILVTAAGGGGGGGGYNTDQAGGGGGGGGSCVLRRPFAVTPGQEIAITIGSGGSAGSADKNGGSGGSTVIGDLLTLPGGSGGGCLFPAGGHGGSGGGGGGRGGGPDQDALPGGGYIPGANGIPNDYISEASSQNYFPSSGGGGAAGGSGGHPNWYSSEYRYVNYWDGGGGGGSYGDGGNGAHATSNITVAATAGKFGGGGGGGAYYNSSYKSAAKAGGSGICIIEW